MVNLTENAKAAITGITAQAELPATGGVRLAMTEANDQVEMSLAPEPENDDHVIEEDGARLFVDATAAELLTDHALDAEQGPEGIGFELRAQ